MLTKSELKQLETDKFLSFISSDVSEDFWKFSHPYMFHLRRFVQFLPFHYIGARICYSSKGVDYLFKETLERTKPVIDRYVYSQFKEGDKDSDDGTKPKDSLKFIFNLIRMGHTSVAGHGYLKVVTDNEDEIPFKEFSMLPPGAVFVIENEEDNVYEVFINTRLFAEYLYSSIQYGELSELELDDFYVISSALDELVDRKYIGENDKIVFTAIEDTEEDDALLKAPTVYMVSEIIIRGAIFKPTLTINKTNLPEKHTSYFFIVENTDKVTTHQIVRHKTLNFTQRSNRYTKVKPNEFLIPQGYKEKIKEIKNERLRQEYLNNLKEYLINQYQYYLNDIKNGIKKEHARFRLSQFPRTSITISGIDRFINDFINQRLSTAAQSEIRTIANYMKQLILMSKK